MTTLLAAAGLWQLGPLHYDANQRQISNTEKQLYLEPRQHQLLLCLLQLQGQVVSRDQLIAQVWQGRIVSDGAINRAVSILRKAFAHLDDQHNYIETLPKLGYRLALPDGQSVTAVVPDAAISGVEQVLLRVTHESGWRKDWRRFAVYTLAVAVLLISVLAMWQQKHATPESLPLPVVQDAAMQPVTSFDGSEFHISLDAAAKRLLYHRMSANNQRQVWLFDRQQEQHRQLSQPNEDARYAAISPDGNQFAYVRFSDDGCKLMLQSLNRPPEVLMDCASDSWPQLYWQADGQALFYRQRPDKTQPYHFYKLSLSSLSSRQLTLTGADYRGDGDLALAVGPMLAVLRYQSAHSRELLLLDVQSGAVQQHQTLPVQATTVHWLGDDLLLVDGNSLYLYRLASQDLHLLYRSPLSINSVAVAADMLYLSTNERSAAIWLRSPDGTEQQLSDSSRIDSLPRIAPDGSALAFLSDRSGEYQVWLKPAHGDARPLAALPGKPGFARFSWHPSAKHLLLVKDGAVYQLDVPAGNWQPLTAMQQVAVANYSEHGEGIYYSSDSSGDWQLWYYEIASGQQTLLPVADAYSAHNLGAAVYFSRHHQDGLWRYDTLQGDIELVLAEFDKVNWLNWQLQQGKVYYYRPQLGIYSYRLADGQQQLLLKAAPDVVHHYSVWQSQLYYVKTPQVQGDVYRLPLRLPKPATP